MSNRYYELYDELLKIVNEIRPYYDVDKTKTYSVYILAKENKNDANEWKCNVFDIEADQIVFYDKGHKIIEDALPIIDKIQSKLKEIESEGKRLIEEENKNMEL